MSPRVGRTELPAGCIPASRSCCWYTRWYHGIRKPAPLDRFRAWKVEATTGFEPVNRGFADLRVKPLHHVAMEPLFAGSREWEARMLAAPRGFEPRFTDPKSAVLPLDEGAAGARRGIGAEDGTRTRDPHLGKVMLYQLSHFRSKRSATRRWCREPGSNWRHRDFQSRALPTELSRPDGQPSRRLPVGGWNDTTGPDRASRNGRSDGMSWRQRPVDPCETWSHPPNSDDDWLADPNGPIGGVLVGTSQHRTVERPQAPLIERPRGIPASHSHNPRPKRRSSAGSTSER